MTKKYSTVYMPTKRKISEYLPYFRYEEDENIEDCGYLIRDVKIDMEEEYLVEKVISGIEFNYNLSNSEQRENLEKEGLKFEYRLNDDQTNSYHLVLDDFAKEYISHAVLNIAVYEGDMEEMVLATADGMCYGHVDTVSLLDKEGKAFLKELMDKGLLKKKRIPIYEEMIDVEDIVDVK